MIVLLKLAEIEHDLSRVRETFVACWGVPLPLQLGASARRSAAHPSHRCKPTRKGVSDWCPALMPQPQPLTALGSLSLTILNYP